MDSFRDGEVDHAAPGAKRRFRRQQLTFAFSAFFMASYVAYSAFIARPGGVTVWTFYLFGDLFSTLMVATFFAFLNDSVTPDAAKRLYGLVGLGGVLGGVFGTTSVSTLIETVDRVGWLWICFAIGAVIDLGASDMIVTGEAPMSLAMPTTLTAATAMRRSPARHPQRQHVRLQLR